MEHSDQGRVGGNLFDKYGSRNPIVRWLMSGFERDLLELARVTGAREAHEVGCGEGHLSRLLHREGLDVRGSDVSAKVIEDARTRTRREALEIPFRVADVFDLQPESDGAELIVCCEVLEHLDDPDGALEVLARLARPWLILSVPGGPCGEPSTCCEEATFAAWETRRATCSHWSKSGFVDHLSEYARPVEVKSPMPWTMVLAKSTRPRRQSGR